jgi:acyl-coenzyme A thioesterase PaaI-like protein
MTLAVTVEELQRLLDHESAFTRMYGFAVTAIGDGTCTLRVPPLPHFGRPGGIAAGQVYFTAADVAMWLAIKTRRGIDDPSVTSHMQTQFLRGTADGFTCTATVLKWGRRTTFGVAECRDDAGELLVHCTMTYVMP